MVRSLVFVVAAGVAAGCGAEPGSGGRDGGVAPLDAAAADAPLVVDSALPSPDGASVDAAVPPGALTLTSTGFLTVDGGLVFPASASSPRDESPPFAWTGVPTAAKSLALTFVDTDNGATKWIVWDIPIDVTGLPGNLSKTVHPSEVPTSTQRGSLGRTGYAGPGVPGPPMHTYEFVLWAVDVDTLPGTDGLTTAEIRADVLPAHRVAVSPTLVAKGQRGGP